MSIINLGTIKYQLVYEAGALRSVCLILGLRIIIRRVKNNMNEQLLEQKKLVGEYAANYVKDGMVVGLGTGSTVYFTIQKIGKMVKEGLSIKAVSTSSSTTVLANKLNIPLVSLNEVVGIDVTIDGADEVDGMFHGIKGGGGALLFEKIVASNSKQNIWVIDSSKYVEKLGGFLLPIEVISLGYTHILE